MKISESMRQFLIDRAQTLHHEARQFPKTRRVVRNWLCQALRFAKQAGDETLYQEILHACLPMSAANKNQGGS